jgi:hypothetical protein
LERGLSSTPSHHQCEGRPPAFQASRATRATNSAVASAACLEDPRGARYSICGCTVRPAFPTPSDFSGRDVPAQLGRDAPRVQTSICYLKIAAKSYRVIASAAKQSILPLRGAMDCFVANAPRNDGEIYPAVPIMPPWRIARRSAAPASLSVMKMTSALGPLIRLLPQGFEGMAAIAAGGSPGGCV